MDLKAILQGKTALFFTLGCKLNFAETSTIAQELQQVGVEKAPEETPADICIINTCSVTSVADRKGRTLIHRVVREHPDAVVVVVGCYAQLKGEEIVKIPGVDLVLGAGRKSEVVSKIAEYFAEEHDFSRQHLFSASREHLHRFEEGCSSDDRTRHFLKVQDGCNYACSYCTIPKARGVSRNGSIATLVASAERVAREGGREIVLTGVNIGDFGRTTGERFIDLVRALDRVEGIERCRISSLEPDLLSDELIDFAAASRTFMPHWHLPLQSGSDSVLRLMRRRYSTELFAQRLQRIKQTMPDAFIGVDVIVGMRGETEPLFRETLDFLRQQPFSQLHVFSYSERSGTDALKIAHSVTPQEKKERNRLLQELSQQHLSDFYRSYRGGIRPVLWERSEVEGMMLGFTDNYIRVAHPYREAWAGTITDTRIGEQADDDKGYCLAEIV